MYTLFKITSAQFHRRCAKTVEEEEEEAFWTLLTLPINLLWSLSLNSSRKCVQLHVGMDLL